MKIAVLGATGTAGTRTVNLLAKKGISVVEVSRSAGVDLISGKGLSDALRGVDVVIDASNTFPQDAMMGLHEALTTATQNVVKNCVTQRVGHLVFLSIAGVEDPVFDDFPYYAAKRAQEEIVAAGPIQSTIVKSTQWYEFATNPSAVSFLDSEVLVQDWLIQPIAADAVAKVLVDTALNAPGSVVKTITGPERIRLPELTSRVLARSGDSRPVRSASPSLNALSEGVLLAPTEATILGPDINTWLASLPSAG
ncbi:nucleoside-diphosphate sugar epimerase [Cryobacterium sp. TMT1-2-2]|uniref:SDR family oxidoreductase n=1 Tax=Cryobacterium sp. TMT1-2-2 TaxID=1259233 RepID=UPI00106C4540|nr:NAD(P)H-binding protein [Cryobacterium sp. TMT1-2-2]TFD12960.1 nucleoside-diphosphate sugar epimerase [Cryobacterium sp. TMT1-2-2]